MSAADEALQEVQEMLDRVDELRRDLNRHLLVIRDLRENGVTWTSVFSVGSTEAVMRTLSGLLANVSKASGTFRSALTAELRQEGMSIPAIARLYGVTHQRVSNILQKQGMTGRRS